MEPFHQLLSHQQTHPNLLLRQEEPLGQSLRVDRPRGASWPDWQPPPHLTTPTFPVLSLFRSLRAGEGGPESPPPCCSWQQSPVAMELGFPLAAGRPIRELLFRASLGASGRALVGAGCCCPPNWARGDAGCWGNPGVIRAGRGQEVSPLVAMWPC